MNLCSCVHNSESEHRNGSKYSNSEEESIVLRSSHMSVSDSVMQTLDRRISASSDQLDTLKKIKSREKPVRTSSSSRISFERTFQFEEKTKQDQTPAIVRKRGSRRSHKKPKTPFQIFLENDGPYSRQMYGPGTPKTQKLILDAIVTKPLNEYELNTPNNSQIRKEKLVYTGAVKSSTKVRT